MARSGWCPPGTPKGGEALEDDAADDDALAQQPDDELDAVLRALAPGSLPGRADRLARLEADRRLVEHLRREDRTGAKTGKLLMAVYEYAHPVVSSLIGSGKIFRQCSRLRCPVARYDGDYQWSSEDRATLTERSVDEGIFSLFLKKGLQQGGWDPQRGATLTTYAVNGCCLCFRSAYRDWWRDRQRELSLEGLTGGLADRVQVRLHLVDPAEQAIDRVDAERLLRRIDDRVARNGLWMRGVEGDTQAQAASRLGLTEKALERRISKARGGLGLTRKAQEGDRDR